MAIHMNIHSLSLSYYYYQQQQQQQYKEHHTNAWGDLTP